MREARLGRVPRPGRLLRRSASPHAREPLGRALSGRVPSAGACRAFPPFSEAGPAARRSNTERERGREGRSPSAGAAPSGTPAAPLPVSVARGSPAAGAARRGPRAGREVRGEHGRRPGRTPSRGAGPPGKRRWPWRGRGECRARWLRGRTCRVQLAVSQAWGVKCACSAFSDGCCKLLCLPADLPTPFCPPNPALRFSGAVVSSFAVFYSVAAAVPLVPRRLCWE